MYESCRTRFASILVIAKRAQRHQSDHDHDQSRRHGVRRDRDRSGRVRDETFAIFTRSE